MKAFIHHIVYEFRAGLRDRSQLLMNYLFPLVFFALMGGLMSGINPGFRATLIPAMALFALMCAFFLSYPAGMVAARDSGLLRSYRINGVPGWAAMIVPPLANLLHMIMVTVIIAVAGRLAFRAALPSDWLRFAAVWLAAAAALSGLGAVIAAVASSSRAAVLISQLAYIPSIVLGGLMMPASVLPGGLARLARIFPASHAMSAFAGGPGSGRAVAILAAGALLSYGVALSLYEWDPKSGRPAGRKLLGLLALAPYAAAVLAGI
jgi:ABC-2 type transport system permease protein